MRSLKHIYMISQQLLCVTEIVVIVIVGWLLHSIYPHGFRVHSKARERNLDGTFHFLNSR
jgi:hypothetical protein